MPLSVTILVDNHGHTPGLRAGRGFSCWVDDGRTRVLFDTGPDGRLIDNAGRLGIDLASVSYIVLSHGHYDHSGGLPALADWYAARGLRPRLLAHPEAFVRREIRLGHGRVSRTLRTLGSPMSREEAAARFELELCAGPRTLEPGDLCFLGEIDRRPCPGQTHVLGSLAQGGADRIADDSALAWPGREGLVVISGCAHSGIGNIVESARARTGTPSVQAVLGGFHLRSAGPLELWRVRRYFGRLGRPRLAACHCSGWGRRWLPRQCDIATGDRLHFA